MHILGCCTFLALPMLFSPAPSKSLAFYTSPFGMRDLIAYALLIVYFYCNYFIFIPRLYFTRKFWAFGSITLGCFILVVWVPIFILHQLYPFPNRPAKVPVADTGFITHAKGPVPVQDVHPFKDSAHHPMKPPYGHGPGFWPDNGGHRPWPDNRDEVRKYFIFGEIGHSIFLFIAVLLFSLIIRIVNRWKQTEKQRLLAELSNLKAQINPHFLFNALNSIYALSLEKSDQAPNAVICLSGMMRYVIYEAGKEWVPLEMEMNYLRDYIALQQMRFGHTVSLTFTVTGAVQGKHIAPLILIPFVENAFKHGVNPEEDSIIRIAVTIEENALSLQVFNHKVHVKHYEANGGGIGLDNTRKRLHIIYPGQHELSIADAETDYTVLLILSRL